MPYLIDGHNLIPKVPGMSLQAIDDEDRLVDALQDFVRSRRQKVEVFFDQAPPTRGGRKSVGSVVIHLRAPGKTGRPGHPGPAAPTGQSRQKLDGGDQRPPGAGRGARIGRQAAQLGGVRGELIEARQAAQTARKENPAPPGPDEIDEWLRLFRNR